ncbi:NAD(P)H dehydrogenase (quinone) [Labedella gwakjiensis]|uniref:NAD(P)H dehydrogenase (Quinone) n=1 Tax=Labedella gwakjiensis TaxID=390269 RepID=A0A2P8GW36_9MICO|nr:SDR family oxidoreductase [Labedella gwakjiensis]PSL38191.1 NAD(P)H dehydrogenase (quinone) [Labedella gwakjiensis]RUQ87266.1 SDR family oxidoreductase [Labedella gwakjiensis]
MTTAPTPIVVTGATGPLGRHIVESLITRGVAAGDIVAVGRNEEKLADLAGTGVRTAVADYADRASLDAALAGAGTLVLVSGSEVGQRVQQHTNAIDAAVAAGVSRIVYTSAPKATTSALILAPEHKATEEYLAQAGVATTILRNSWYTENYAADVDRSAESGVLVSSTGDGRVASASRADYAEAVAAVLTSDGHEGAVYELSGDVAWTYADLAAAITEITGKPVEWKNVSSEEHVAILTGAGLDEGTAGFVSALDGNIRDGLLAETSGDLSRLIGRPTTPLVEGLRTATGR